MPIVKAVNRILLLGTIFMSIIHAAPNSQAALTFINALSDSQKAQTVRTFDDSRSQWHYLPATMFDRKGIQIRELNTEQRQLLNNLLQGYLSQKGYEKTKNIMGLENVLRELEGSSHRDPELYHVVFYGNPATDALWGWKFEGHHISLNFTVADDQISCTPRFFGANPAEVRSGSQKGLRVLKEEEDIAFKLMAGLSAEQLRKTIFSATAFSDILTTNKPYVTPLEKQGIQLKELNNDQQDLIKELIMEYLSAMPDDLAHKRMRQVEESNFKEIFFGWAGDIGLHKPHYYRIQGDKFLIELDNTQNDANHIHCVWRDFDGDFGKDIIREHYNKSDHHDH